MDQTPEVLHGTQPENVQFSSKVLAKFSDARDRAVNYLNEKKAYIGGATGILASIALSACGGIPEESIPVEETMPDDLVTLDCRETSLTPPNNMLTTMVFDMGYPYNSWVTVRKDIHGVIDGDKEPIQGRAHELKVSLTFNDGGRGPDKYDENRNRVPGDPLWTVPIQDQVCVEGYPEDKVVSSD